jgi:hypothetical protein
MGGGHNRGMLVFFLIVGNFFHDITTILNLFQKVVCIWKINIFCATLHYVNRYQEHTQSYKMYPALHGLNLIRLMI